MRIVIILLLTSAVFAEEYCEWKICATPKQRECRYKSGFMPAGQNAKYAIMCLENGLYCQYSCKPVSILPQPPKPKK